MDRAGVIKKALDVLKQYRYAAIILAAGIIMMLLPGKKEQASAPEEAPQAQTQEAPSQDLETRLSQLLSQVRGAGEVKVLLTKAEGEKTIYQTDDDISADDSRRSDTVLITDSQRNQDGLILQTLPPIYLGAIVLCQGADSADVRLAVTEAVSVATGLSSDKISVLKMK